MNWLDLGWLKRGDAWEFHPWGPFTRGYLLTSEEAREVRGRVRQIRLAMVLIGAAAVLAWLRARHWWPLALAVATGIALEAGLTWWVVRQRLRTESALGWENGLLYLAQWLGPKLLTLARIAALGLAGWFAWLLVRQPTRPGLYLLVGAFVAVQFFVNYLEQVQRR